MKADIDPGKLYIARGMFENMTGNDLRKLITRTLKDRFGESAAEIYNGKALDVIAKGSEGIVSLPPEQAEALVDALVIVVNICAVLDNVPAEQCLKIRLKPGATEAATAINGTHGILLIISPKNRRKLENLGEIEEDRTFEVVVRSARTNWSHLIRQIMGYVESIDRVVPDL